MILLLSGRTRPLRSHYLLCESLYPPCIEIAGWIIIKHRNGCSINGMFAFRSLPVLIKSKYQVEVETRDQPVDMLR